MAVTSRTELIEAMASSRFDDLLGTEELSWLDFKGVPYTLDTDKGKFELCKDVVAFANAQGGLLVLGVAEEKKIDQPVAVAARLQPFPLGRANVVRYVDVLNEYLRPRVRINSNWYPDRRSGSTGAPDGYLVVDVGPVPEE